MTIILRYFDDCPNWRLTADLLDELAAERGLIVERHLVETAEEAARVGFLGSPSILIDGRDPFATEDAPVGLSCRIYLTPDGPAGSPTREQLAEVLG